MPFSHRWISASWHMNEVVFDDHNGEEWSRQHRTAVQAVNVGRPSNVELRVFFYDFGGNTVATEYLTAGYRRAVRTNASADSVSQPYGWLQVVADGPLHITGWVEVWRQPTRYSGTRGMVVEAERTLEFREVPSPIRNASFADYLIVEADAGSDVSEVDAKEAHILPSARATDEK